MALLTVNHGCVEAGSMTLLTVNHCCVEAGFMALLTVTHGCVEAMVYDIAHCDPWLC